MSAALEVELARRARVQWPSSRLALPAGVMHRASGASRALSLQRRTRSSSLTATNGVRTSNARSALSSRQHLLLKHNELAKDKSIGADAHYIGTGNFDARLRGSENGESPETRTQPNKPRTPDKADDERVVQCRYNKGFKKLRVYEGVFGMDKCGKLRGSTVAPIPVKERVLGNSHVGIEIYIFVWSKRVLVSPQIARQTDFGPAGIWTVRELRPQMHVVGNHSSPRAASSAAVVQDAWHFRSCHPSYWARDLKVDSLRAAPVRSGARGWTGLHLSPSRRWAFLCEEPARAAYEKARRRKKPGFERIVSDRREQDDFNGLGSEWLYEKVVARGDALAVAAAQAHAAEHGYPPKLRRSMSIQQNCGGKKEKPETYCMNPRSQTRATQLELAVGQVDAVVVMLESQLDARRADVEEEDFDDMVANAPAPRKG
ncbi:hypothetical protein DFH06DRAFT_1124241 [Mycena polygramma]|nr:hypothetical protein DFH06DRAFT_1124241 [Mycena polygramma]